MRPSVDAGGRWGSDAVLLPKLGCELVVINRDRTEEDDLTKDLIAVITSFCCRLYGRRRGAAKARAVVAHALES